MTGSLVLQHGSPEAVSKVEKRRREALAPASPTDQLHSLLLKHQQGDLWPLQPAEQDHFKRLLGLAPPLPEPVILPPPAQQPHHFAPGPGGLQNGRPAQPGASPLMDNWWGPLHALFPAGCLLQLSIKQLLVKVHSICHHRGVFAC